MYCDDRGWARFHPLKARKLVHESLSLLFARDGVPDTVLVDGAREQVAGEFRKKTRDAGCHVKETEPHSP